MHVLFANTGVQIVCIPLRGGSRYQTSQIGYGWQRTTIAGVAPNDPPRTFPYVQWQIIQSGTTRLLLELAGEISQTPQMLPFELTNRYHLDAWSEEGEPVSQPAARWFSSKTHWCNTPYLPPMQQKKTDY